MKCSVFLVAMALYALNLASAQSTIKLRRLGGHEDLNHTNYIDHEAMRVAAKYAKNAQMYFQNTGKHHSVVNGTTLSRRADSGDIKLRMLDAATWVGDIEVGTPGQKQTVKFDSGSPNIVIGRDSYKPDQSITARGLRKDFEVAYVGAKVHGSVYTDEVNVAGVKAKHVAIGSSKSNFLGANEDQDLVGLFGLSYPNIGSFDVPDENTYVVASKKQKIFYDDIFQFYIRRNGDSFMNVGKIDKDGVDGDITWVDVDKSEGYWKADIEINGHKTSGTVDSGSTFLWGNNDEVKKILDEIDGVEVKKSDSGDWRGWYKCDNPPEVKLKVADMEVTMSKDAIIAGVQDDQCQLCIVGMDGINSWIYGVNFFQMFTVILDFDKERMGLGKQKE